MEDTKGREIGIGEEASLYINLKKRSPNYIAIPIEHLKFYIINSNPSI